MSEKTSIRFQKNLKKLGVTPGSIIYLGIDIGKVPLPNIDVALTKEAIREREQHWCKFILENLLDAVGPNGTLLVPTFSYSCGAPGTSFHLETTPSEVGPFTEFFRKSPNVFRSTHPIFSVAGIGAKAKMILENTGKAAFGGLSPYGRMHEHGAMFVALGVQLRNSMTYVHHLEQTYGCNHRYNKMFHTPVYKNGVLQKGPWLAYVSYQSTGSLVDIKSFEEMLKKVGVLREHIDDGIIYTWSGSAVIKVTQESSAGSDPYFFLDETEEARPPL